MVLFELFHRGIKHYHNLRALILGSDLQMFFADLNWLIQNHLSYEYAPTKEALIEIEHRDIARLFYHLHRLDNLDFSHQQAMQSSVFLYQNQLCQQKKFLCLMCQETQITGLFF